MLYFAAAVLVGIGSSQGWGESKASPVLSADLKVGRVQAEGWLTTSDKVETGDGWASRLGADVWAGPVSVGAHWSHRSTSAWVKDRLFLRASAKVGILRVFGEMAPDSPNRERRVEARLRLGRGHLLVEPRYWYGWHSVGQGHGATILAGVGW